MPRLGVLANLLSIIVVTLSSGCFLPIGTAAPESARTLGRGGTALTFSGEAPTLNLVADTDSSGSTSNGNELPVAPAAAMKLGVSLGLSDSVDIEAVAEGAMWAFILPMPLGGSLGFRANVVSNGNMDLAIAGRAGYLSLSAGSSSSGDHDEASASYFAGSSVLQLVVGPNLRPGIAVELMPARVKLDLADRAAQNFDALSLSITLMLEIVGGSSSLTPFVSFTTFESPDVKSSRFTSFGLAFQYGKADRRNLVPALPPSPGPSMSPPPPAAPSAPAPAPAPAPASPAPSPEREPAPAERMPPATQPVH